MTTLIPDSWELPAYTAGDLVPMDKYRGREREVIPDADEDGDWERDAEIRTHPSWAVRRGPEVRRVTDPSTGLSIHVRNPDNWEHEFKPFDPSDYPDRDFYNQDDLDHLEQHGFTQVEPGVWSRHVTHPSGQPMAAQHILTYDPGHRRPTTGERAPWVLTTNPDTVGIAFPSLRGNRGAMAAANADQAAVQRMSRVGAFITHLSHLMFRTAADKTPAQIAAEKWLEENPEGFEEWHPSESDYTYRDFGDAAGQSFHGDEAESHVLPGSHYHPDADWETGLRHEPAQWTTEGQQQGDRMSDYGDGNSEWEQHLADLGFNWRNRGDRDTTPVDEYLRGEWVREQHTPEGEHIATHTLREVPTSPAQGRWHLEHNPAGMPDFAESYTQHRFPHDAVSYYHTNAENALLPSRGYEPHRGRSGVITHWTRTDTDPHSGQTYEHEISQRQPAGEEDRVGWVGQTHSDAMPENMSGRGTAHLDLADLVREQESLSRGLHPGGSQDYRTTRAELLADPSVARLGNPSRVSDGFYGDGKVGSATWQLPHPNPPSRTVFDPTAPGHAREVPSENPWINAEATYNWHKGGYDFKYTHDGQQIYPNQEHFPAGAPVHVPGRQTQLPLESAR